VIPVGLTLSFPQGKVPAELHVNQEISIAIPGFENILHGIEAGPLLLDEGKWSIDMNVEGWKTQNSIATQAARLDYLDMRGPKIAVGMNEEGELMVLTVNGRIRESVGATHGDMAGILARHGMVRAMGFDPGGSSTLFANGRILNISPYNRAYELNNYALPPQPRAVSNAVIGYL
jgi:exopolysaccharide biosynthesis protein